MSLHPIFASILESHKHKEPPVSRVWDEECQRRADAWAELDWPADTDFRYFDPNPNDAHGPCYVEMPGGALLQFHHHGSETVDIARARWVVDACNEKLARMRSDTP